MRCVFVCVLADSTVHANGFLLWMKHWHPSAEHNPASVIFLTGCKTPTYLLTSNWVLTQCECRNHGCKCQHIITAQRQYPKGIVHMWIQLYCFLVISTGKCASTSKPAWIGGMKFCQDCETILQTDAAHVNEPLGLYRTEPWNQNVGGGWKTSTIIKVKIKTKFLYFFYFFSFFVSVFHSPLVRPEKHTQVIAVMSTKQRKYICAWKIERHQMNTTTKTWVTYDIDNSLCMWVNTMCQRYSTKGVSSSLEWSLCMFYSLTCQGRVTEGESGLCCIYSLVRVTVGNSGLCCCVPVMSFEC